MIWALRKYLEAIRREKMRLAELMERLDTVERLFDTEERNG